MKICILRKGIFEKLPAIMSLALVLKEQGHDVEVLTSYSEQKTKNDFAEKGITIIDLCPELEEFSTNILVKFRYWRAFSKQAWKQIKQRDADTLFWVSTADSAMALGRRLLRYRYLLHLRELYDIFPLYRYGLAKYARNSCCVVAPEMCRAAIFRSWFGLKQTPMVLPNKPSEHPRQRKLEIEDEQARAIIAAVPPNDKIVFFQGHIVLDQELRPVAEAIRNLGPGWRLAAMGPASAVHLDSMKQICPNFIHIPRVIAPTHLQVTSHAYIGLVPYNYEELNNVFCAPNKIWEYAGFGMPMVCDNMPSLQISVQAGGAGLCIDQWDSESIEAALRKIDQNYDSFRRAAVNLYESVDIREIIRTIVERARICGAFT